MGAVDRQGGAAFAAADLRAAQHAAMDMTAMSEAKISFNRPTNHSLLPAVAIGGLSVLLAAGLGAVGILARVNLVIGHAVGGISGKFPESLPRWSIWLATAAFAIGLAFSILHAPGTWRRVMLWITTVVVVAGWAPVLALAARAPEIAAPLVAVIWSGVCALVYAAKHEISGKRASEISPENPHEAR